VQLDGKEWTIAGMAVGWCGTLIGYGRTYGSLLTRVKILESAKEKAEKVVTEAACLERHRGCEEKNSLQFAAGNNQFTEIKGMISDLNKSHSRLIELLLEGKNK